MTVRVAYLVSRFPKTSETFVVDEVLALERAGVSVRLIALADGRGATVGPETRELSARAQRLAPLSPRLLVEPLRWLLREPRALLGVLAQVVVTHAASPRALARALVASAHAIAHAAALERAGVLHVHAHFATHTALAALVIHRLTGLPYSFTAHADDLFVARPMLAEKVREAAFVATISEYNRAWLREHVRAAATTPIELVRCGLDAEALRPGAGPRPGAPFTLVCVARLEPKKGHLDLLDACAELARRGTAFELRLVGEGRARAAIEARARALGLADRVLLLGARARGEVLDEVRRAHVFVLPCVTDARGRADGIPVALMEAMALERPVVSTRLRAIPELVEHEVSGLLVEPGDVHALAAALERLRGDAALARRLGTAARRRVQASFDLATSARHLRELFAASAARRPCARPLDSTAAAVDTTQGTVEEAPAVARARAPSRAGSAGERR